MGEDAVEHMCLILCGLAALGLEAACLKLLFVLC